MLDVGGVADGVADVVKGDGAGYASVGHAAQSGLDGGGVGGVGSLDGLQRHIVGVVAHGGHGGDHVVAAVGGLGVGVGVNVALNTSVEFRVAALLIEGGDIQLNVGALGGVQNLIVVQGIGAHEGSGETKLVGLGDDLGGVGDGDGGEDDLGPLVLGLVQVRGEVGVVFGEGVGDDLAAGSLEGGLEEGHQTLVILVACLAQAVGNLGVELIHGKVGQYGALEGVQEADAVVVVVASSDVGVGAGHTHSSQAGVVKDGAAGHGHAGAIGAQHDSDSLAHQLGGGGRGLGLVGAVVAVDQLHLIGLAADLNGGGLEVGVLHTQHFLLAAGGGVAGGGLEHADFNDLVAGGLGGGGAGGLLLTAAGRKAEGHGKRKRKGKKLFHTWFSFTV